MSSSQASWDQAARRTERVLGVLRVLAGLWAVALVVSYPDYPASHADVVRDWALILVLGFLVSSVVVWLAVEVAGNIEPSTSAAIGLVLDSLVATGISFVYGFDQVSAVWIIVFLLPVEGAMRFQLRGAAATMAITVVGYIGSEFAWYAWIDQAPDWRSISFRMTVVAIVAVFVGMISEQLRAEREIAREALARVEQSERWRQRLVSALGHDLRGPIGNVEMQARMARDSRLSPEARDRMLYGVVRQARRVGRLASGLLDLAMAEQADLVLRRESVDVAGVISDAVELLGLESKVEVDVEDGLIIDGDEDRLAQVMLNLLSNARKYGSTPIEVSGRLEAGWAVISVRDHGPGIPDDLRETLFEEFTSGGGQGAVGFGLHLVSLIVAAHDGRVEVGDVEPGAEFTVRLPHGRIVKPRSVDVTTGMVEAEPTP